MYVIGTAGHVDHGKSTLVQALTGVHPDRLKEEREREMTIDLGFAWLALPSGEEVGIIDVPGHRDFIENMLAGIGGIDAALFVIASDEGVMPQTREHLAILDLLQIQAGIVALTKIDMIDDEWLELVQDDVRRVIHGTVLENAPILPVSARSMQGIPELMHALEELLANTPHRLDLGKPRLPIDRVFTIAGFGTVVTGTLSDGQLKAGDEIQILPGGLRGRVRGLQTHKRKEDTATPGSRTAVNISGINVEQVQRGEVLAHPGDYLPTRRIDVHFRLLPDAAHPLRHNVEAKLFIGSSEVICRVRLLGEEELAPGHAGWLQLELSQPVVAVRGDHYILRRPSPSETLGGGIVVEPRPKRRHKRFSEEVISNLESLSHGAPADILYQALVALEAAPLKDVILRSNLNRELADKAARHLLEQGLLIVLETGRPGNEAAAKETADALAPTSLVTSQDYWNSSSERILLEVKNYHRTNPLRGGLSREELKSRQKNLSRSSAKAFNAILARLVTNGKLEESGALLHAPGFSIRFNQQQELAVNRLLARFAAAPYSTPSVKECQAEVGEDVFQALLETGKLVSVAPDVVFRKEDYDAMVAQLRQLIVKHGQVSAAQVRDHFNTSRKYALAFLEHLDGIGITIRDGDFRRLKSRYSG